MTDSKKHICIIGPFPPPIHGLALINQMITEQIEQVYDSLIIMDTKSDSLKRNPINIIKRLFKVSGTIIHYLTLLMTKKVKTLYISLSGGWGQIYDLIFIFLSTIFKVKVFIHHHSFAYLDKKKLLSNLIINISQNNTKHVVLCDRMGEALKKYNNDISILEVSNIAFIEEQSLDNNNKQKDDFITIGFLSNISFDKGIFEYVELFKYLTEKVENVNGIIAGPFSDNKSKQYLEQNLKDIKHLIYVGPVTDQSKANFFNKIDFLVFPSKNEAEPLVILESMSYGIPVIARSIGCINQMFNKKSGIIINHNDDFIVESYNQIKKYNNRPDNLNKLKLQVHNDFIKQRINGIQSLKILINNIVNTY